jgi:hypothetical protein
MLHCVQLVAIVLSATTESVTKLWRHLRPDENDNVGALPLNVLFEKVEDDMQQ